MARCRRTWLSGGHANQPTWILTQALPQHSVRGFPQGARETAIIDGLRVDGLRFDIIQPQGCSCLYRRSRMEARGLDLWNASSRQHYGLSVVNSLKRDLTRSVREFDERTTVFNSQLTTVCLPLASHSHALPTTQP